MVDLYNTNAMHEDQTTSVEVNVTGEIDDDDQRFSTSSLRTIPDGEDSIAEPVEEHRNRPVEATNDDDRLRTNRRRALLQHQTAVDCRLGPYVLQAPDTTGSLIPVSTASSRSSTASRRGGMSAGDGQSPKNGGSRPSTGGSGFNLHADYSIPDQHQPEVAVLPHCATAPANMQQLAAGHPLRVAVRGMQTRSPVIEELVCKYMKAKGRGPIEHSWSDDGKTMIIAFKSPNCIDRLIRQPQSPLGEFELEIIPIEPDIEDPHHLCRPFFVQCDSQGSSGLAQATGMCERADSDVADGTCDGLVQTSVIDGHEDICCTLHNYFDENKIHGVRLDYVRESRRVVVVLPPAGHDHLIKLGWRRDRPDDPVTVQYEGRSLTLHPLPTVNWVAWVGGALELNVILAGRLPDKLTKDELKNYFYKALGKREDGNRRTVVNVKFVSDQQALVFYDPAVSDESADADYRTVRHYVLQQPLKGHMISVRRLPLSRKLKVGGLNDQLNNECIEDHFTSILVDKPADATAENQPSFPQPQLHRIQVNYALVTFNSRDDLDFIMQQANYNRLCGQELRISIYYDINVPNYCTRSAVTN